MDLLPILSTLRRHKTAAGLIIVEIALTSAIVCNALHMISQRIETLNHDSGLPENELVVLGVRSAGGQADVDEVTARDVAALRQLPGVKSVALVSQVIYGNNSSNTDVRKTADKTGPRVAASLYAGGEQALATMGLRLIDGRDFQPQEYQASSVIDKQDDPNVGQVIVNRQLAEKLYPGQSAVGQPLYGYVERPSTIVGVVERLTHPYPGRSERDEGYAMLFPVRPSFRGGTFLVRTDPDQREAVLKAAPAIIERNDPTRILHDAKTLSEMRAAFYAQDHSMVGLMVGVIVALLVVTAFGIVGLASFWVQQRTRMIGTRRAMGATRGQILRYFQLENFLLSTLGIALGMGGAFVLSLVLMNSYEMPRLPLWYLPVGALVLWGLGQLAVLAPARRASALPPVQALRS
ncbi:ABC transporter permease [Ideonella sp. YS5]|uniref:ABC transporter permease n=1 Tax=Ideonella sp. YS5 TaxID=3453714 RepID=UPI003EEEE8BC